MTDKQLYKLCKKYGARLLESRRKFAGLLPEVARRRLYEKRGFGSIHEFAARLGGLTRDQVDGVLRLEKRFVDLPVLREALVKGEVSASKLARVAAVATTKNSAGILQMAKSFSYAALDIKVREIKIENGLFETKMASKSLCAQTLAELGVSEEVAEQLMNLKEKGLDLNQILVEMLQKRADEIESEATRIQQKMDMTIADRSRYVPVKVRRLIYKKFGKKCSRENCGKLAVNLHHLKQYAFGGSQTPENLLPVCRGHHMLAHVEGVTQGRRSLQGC